MDILYIVNKDFSYCNEDELRWSLRSLEKYGKNIDKIYVVGNIPDFLSDEVIKLPHEDKYKEYKNFKEKHANLADHVLYAINNSDISDDFLISMDDHYLLKETDFENYPIYVKAHNYNNGSGLLPIIYDNEQSEYYNNLVYTAEILTKYELPINNFTLHKNMKCNKQIWNECFDKFPEFFEGCEPFSATLNYAYTKTTFNYEIIKDTIVSTKTFKEKLTKDITSFSSSDMVTYCKLFDWMNELYPNISKYESNPQ